MVSVADNVTGHVVQLLKEKKMWDNTLMVVSADNGGAPCAGSNFPLKGSKMTMFEGGIRALAFANGGVLARQVKDSYTLLIGILPFVRWLELIHPVIFLKC